jgi:hypothetical protein
MLLVSSSIITDENCKINDVIISFDDLSGNENVEYAKPDEGYYPDERWELRDKFENSDVVNEVQRLREEIIRLERLDRYNHALKKKEELINKILEQTILWVSLMGDTEGYFRHEEINYFIEDMMKAYVVLRDHDRMKTLKDLAQELHSLVGDEGVDFEIFAQDYEKYLGHIDIFKKIYNFIETNPKFKQKNLFYTLSIDGRKCRYMLDFADKLNEVSRVRHKDTWLLSVE